ncbi:TniQ family protein [Kitasatospora sp. MBT63]|uniref:TniQ family protein n=1 Tax=Kitasatospora sp. MBT63 TaxID=1444768 RepID=UPI000539A47B|nr:TniQ family protein [Kitasatospora sp. MBT63]
MTGRPLPRSLAPLPEESMAGFLLRLSFRIRRSPARTAELAGLGPVRDGRLSTDHLLGLAPAAATAFAAATRLTASEVAHLGLRRFEDAYPALKAVPAHRRIATAFFARTWAFTLAPRFCPTCLAGDGSPIQDLLGGAWKASWHLPVVFACPAHQRLLAHRCPHCGGSPNPIHHRRAALLHRPSTPGIHPLACRGDAAPPGSGRPGACGPVCGARLDQPPPGAHPPPATGGVGRLIGLQQRLQARLHGAGPAPGGAYFLDLAATSQLITLSWPAPADGLTLEPSMLDLIDDHVETTRAGAQDRTDRGLPNPQAPDRWAAPQDSATCGALLLAAEHLLGDEHDPGDVRERLQPLAEAAFRRDASAYTALRGKTISPRLARALVRHRHGFHAAGRTENDSVRVASRDCRFGPQHVPPYLPQPWYDQHFADFADRLNNPTSYTPRHLRRAVSLKLAEMAAGGSYSQCARLLGIPVAKATSTMSKLRPQMGPTLWRDFEHRVDQIARRLDDDQTRVDYTRRRTALTYWQLPAEHWAELFDDLSSRFPRMAGDDGRLTATVLVWTDITQAEYTHSPVLTGLREAKADSRRLIDNITQTYTPANQKAGRLVLRRRITAYADRLAQRLDHGPRPERPTE